VKVGATRHLFFVDFVLSLGEAALKLAESLLVVGDGALDLCLLDFKTGDLLADAIVFFLLERDQFFGLVVLLLDLAELDGHLVDFLLVVLEGRSVVGRLQERVHLDEGVGAIVDLELLLHDRAAHALQLSAASRAFATVTVHSD